MHRGIENDGIREVRQQSGFFNNYINLYYEDCTKSTITVKTVMLECKKAPLIGEKVRTCFGSESFFFFLSTV